MTEAHRKENDHWIDIQVAGHQLKFIIDSGADINAITPEMFETLNKNPDSKLMRITDGSRRKLHAYGDAKPLTVIATFYAEVFFDERRPTGKEKFFVVKEARRALMSRGTAIRYSVLMLGRGVPIKRQETKREAYHYLQNVSVSEKSPFPKFNLPPVSLNIDPSVRPRRNTYTNIPFAWRETAQDRIKEMEARGIIEKVDKSMEQTHCSAMLVVPKGPDDFRIVIDLRSTNQCIVREPHKMPTMDSILAELYGSKWFSTVDLSSAFYHVEIEESSRHVTNFFTGKEFYRFKRLPFGLCNAPDIFQKALETVLAGIEGVMIYLDDILIYAKDEEIHDKILGQVLKALRSHGVKLNEGKCVFKQPSLRFLGFTISSNGYSVTQDRLEAIRNFRTPKSVAEVQSFIGMLIFVDKFVFSRADKTLHLQSLIRSKKFIWGEEEQKEFESLRKEVLHVIKKLGYYRQGDRTEILVDASPFGLGAIVVQYDEKDKPRLIGCASKVLSRAEAKYPQVQREALSIVWGVERFQMMLRGQAFKILTDNLGNEFIFGKTHRMGKRWVTRAEAWALRLLPFKFEIEHIPGNMNAADVFSRLVSETQPVEEFKDFNEDHVMMLEEREEFGVTTLQVAQETEKDPDSITVAEALESGCWEKVSKELRRQKELWQKDGGVLVHNNKMFIPTKLRASILKNAHKSHFGVGTIKRTLRQFVCWPGISKNIETLVADCEICQRNTDYERPIPLKSRELPDEPWKVIQIDFLQIPLGSKELLMVCETYTRMTWAIEMKKIDTIHTIKALQNIFAIWGNPEVIQSDNGPPFNAKEFSEHWTKRGIRHNRVIPRSPWMNGVVERRNIGIKNALSAAVQEGRDWRDALQEHINYYNNARPHSTTLATPFELMTGRMFRGMFPVAPSWSARSKFNHEMIKFNDSTAKKKSITRANLNSRAKESEIKANDWVWVKDWNRANKLSPIYHKKRFIVLDRSGPRTRIMSEDGQVLTRWVSQLKKTSKETKEIAANDEVLAEMSKNKSSISNQSTSQTRPSNHRFKVIAEEDGLVTIRSESGDTRTCDQSNVEKIDKIHWNKFNQTERDLHTTPEGSSAVSSSLEGSDQTTSKHKENEWDEEGDHDKEPGNPFTRPSRVKKVPAHLTDFKLYNIFG